MRCRLLLTVLAALLLVQQPVMAQTEPDEQLASLGQLQELARTLGDALVQGEQSRVLVELSHYGSRNYRSPKVAPQLVPAAGYELIGHQELGESLYRIRLLEKYADRGRLWSLVFYRAERHWQLAELVPSDNLLDAFVH